jgi:hypothetical protein
MSTQLPLLAGPFGKVSGEAVEAYHANPAVSHSKMQDFRRIPEYYYRKHVLKVECLNEDGDEPTALLRGSMAHACILEHALEARYVVEPDYGDCRKKENKAARDEWRAANTGRKPVSAEDMDTVKRIEEAVRKHPLATQLLANGEPEVSWRHQLPDFAIQCRTDWWSEAGCELSGGEPYFVDLKTTSSLSDDVFGNWAKSYERHGYFRQAPFYAAVLGEVLGRPVRKMFYIVVENREPYGVMVFAPSPESFLQGWVETLEDLKRMAQCYQSNEWPGYPKTLQTIDLPSYYYAKKR